MFIFNREHLGIEDKNSQPIDLRDPVCDTFYKETWIKTAAVNTSIYEKVSRMCIYIKGICLINS